MREGREVEETEVNNRKTEIEKEEANFELASGIINTLMKLSSLALMIIIVAADFSWRRVIGGAALFSLLICIESFIKERHYVITSHRTKKDDKNIITPEPLIENTISYIKSRSLPENLAIPALAAVLVGVIIISMIDNQRI